LPGNVSGARSGNIDPNSGEESAGAKYEDGVDDSVDGVLLDVI